MGDYDENLNLQFALQLFAMSHYYSSLFYVLDLLDSIWQVPSRTIPKTR